MLFPDELFSISSCVILAVIALLHYIFFDSEQGKGGKVGSSMILGMA